MYCTKVEEFEEYECTETIVDRRLSSSQTTDSIYNICQSCLHFLQKTHSKLTIIKELFYKSFTQSVLTLPLLIYPMKE